MNRVKVKHQSERQELIIGLIGNPNCGKTTLFNLLTGIRQKVGNWPGVTVERKTGRVLAGQMEVEMVDLPGLYSLIVQSPDEAVAKDYLTSGEPGVVINVVDASNLERSLYLTSQLLELGLPVVVGLNMMDTLEKLGLEIDCNRLSLILGCPVVPLVAKKKQGSEDLLTEALRAADFAPQKPLRSPVMQAEERLEWVGRAAKEVLCQVHPARQALSDSLDKVLLHRYFGLPLFFLAMYMVFFISINFSTPFIDFIDATAGALLIDGLGGWIQEATGQTWLRILLAEGIGGGVQTVLTFIPPIGLLFLTLSLLEDSGYMARATVLLDRFVRRLGLPGKAVVPMIVGFGCSVPALLSTRTLEEERDRQMTLAMVPFMSCGAKLPVYAMFAAAFFPQGGQNLVFLLYFIGIVVGLSTGLILKRLIFLGKPTPLLIELPAYQVPSLFSIFTTTWIRLRRFLVEAGRLIVLIVALLTLLNSVSLNGGFGSKNSENSILASVGRSITPIFYGMGLTDENWPATVGIFSGIFAKEAIIGTLDSMYSSLERGQAIAQPPPASVSEQIGGAFVALPGDVVHALGNFLNPLGMDLEQIGDQEQMADQLQVNHSSFGVMVKYFDGQAGAFAYLLWVLLYAPCVAATATLRRESGGYWTLFTVVYMTGLAWSFSTLFYQVLRFNERQEASMPWVLAALIILASLIFFLQRWGKKVLLANYRAKADSACASGGVACGKCL